MLEHIHSLERSLLHGRRWIVAMDVLVPASSLALRLRDRGALDVFAIGGNRGTGALAELPPGQLVALGAQGQGMMGGIRAAEAALDALPPEVLAQLDRWDPGREAQVLRAAYSAGRPVGGRRVWGARPAHWQALEDKTVIDALWDRAGVPRAPSRVVPADAPSIAAAAAALDQGAGVVVAGDSREGFHGGATGTRWVRKPADLAGVMPYFTQHHDHVRVMPFVDGIPCSIHGIVLNDGVVALRPAEMIVLRRPGRPELVYAGCATWWDPPAPRREAMRGMARQVGAALREGWGYRGAFTVDGVMGVDGFVPTELNPRVGSAMYGVVGAGVLLDLLNGAWVEGVDLGLPAAELEAWLLGRSDSVRSGGVGQVVRAPEQPRLAFLRYQDGVCVEVAEGDGPDLRAEWGPGPSGGYLRLSGYPERTPTGPSAAPRAAAALRWADLAWGLDIGELETAPNLV